MIALRPYQQEAIDATMEYWTGNGGNPLVEMATGTGKSAVIAALVQELFRLEPSVRLLMLVHVRELVAQNAAQLLRFWPGAPIGINSAGLGRRDTRHPIIFASVQSVFRKPEALGPRDLVVVDEAHLVPASGEGMYHQLLSGLRELRPDLRVFGCTATPFRLDSGRLDRGADRFFDRIVYSYGIGEGIRGGFLSPLLSKGMRTEIDVSGVARQGGEFKAGSLEAAADKDAITQAAVREIIEYGRDRRSWLVFATSVKHAFHLRDAFRQHGISCEAVSGETPKAERDSILGAFKAGRIRCVTNCSVLTTGFDAPGIDLLALLRPTLSTGLYVQMVGRGTRLSAGKDNCLVLDFSGNVRRHGPVDDISVAGSGAGAAKVREEEAEFAAKVTDVRAKQCPVCQALLALQARSCSNCGHEFRETPKHEATADQTPILSGRTDPNDWRPVTDVGHFEHRKRGAGPETPPTLRVSYFSGLKSYDEWLCFSHPINSMPQRRAAAWWVQRGGAFPIPESVDDALARIGELRPVDAIRVKKNDEGYDRVTSIRCAPKQETLSLVLPDAETQRRTA
ncbi:MAG: DEAD/DEAH box helicase [Beijerinckiaceae bacterium]|nr:DEAD/DEAH box helicase [Beijerinckiaceae bacterium]